MLKTPTATLFRQKWDDCRYQRQLQDELGQAVFAHGRPSRHNGCLSMDVVICTSLVMFLICILSHVYHLHHWLYLYHLLFQSSTSIVALMIPDSFGYISCVLPTATFFVSPRLSIVPLFFELYLHHLHHRILMFVVSPSFQFATIKGWAHCPGEWTSWRWAGWTGACARSGQTQAGTTRSKRQGFEIHPEVAPEDPRAFPERPFFKKQQTASLIKSQWFEAIMFVVDGTLRHDAYHCFLLEVWSDKNCSGISWHGPGSQRLTS